VRKIIFASKDYICSEHSYHKITKGELHLVQTMTPWHEANESKKFLTYRTCLRCAERYGMMCSETRAQLKSKTQPRSEHVLR